MDACSNVYTIMREGTDVRAQIPICMCARCAYMCKYGCDVPFLHQSKNEFLGAHLEFEQANVSFNLQLRLG